MLTQWINQYTVVSKGSKVLRQTTNQGLEIIDKNMLAVCSTFASVQMIASLGSDAIPLAASPSPPHVPLAGNVKQPTLFAKSLGGG